MTERLVQVPESVVKAAARHLDREGYPGTATLLNDALLSQPEPSGQPACECGHAMNRHTQASGCTAGWTGEAYGCRCGAVPAQVPPAEPLSIEQMAPGTTFTACRRGHDDADQFVVLNDGVRCIAPGRWYHGIATDARYASDRIDPSTIRDVTPPPTTPDTAGG